MYYYTHASSVTALGWTLQMSTGEDAATTLHPQHRSNPESRLSEGDPYGSPAEVPVQPQTMCAGSQAGLEKPFIHLADRATTLPELANYCDHWGSIRGEVLGREGSVSPMCGCTLLLGSPHKNSGLRRCSTRQPTMYSYTSSHCSPCLGQFTNTLPPSFT